ncbi:MAG TPA: hypothetical protein VEW64_10775 [Methyloceanibacter sp.]|jgi:hypothetical protein|nr:hypothetical protein [Methyloceanibacter sp.]
MLRGAGGWLLVGCVVLVAHGAQAANLSVSLRNFYTEYEVVKQCLVQAQLPPDDAETAKAAIGKIETHYLQRDASINKDRLLKEAVANKDQGLKMVTATRKVDLRQYCRVSLNELLTKAEEIGASVKPQ